MSRYTGPKTRINRRFALAIFPPNKAFERRNYLPGVHGQRPRRKVTDYGIGLNEKQKLRFLYGLTERQFRLAFARAKRATGATGDVFLRMLEMRLDSVVYLSGLAKTRRAARQMVAHGHVHVNGRGVNIASTQCRAGDRVTICQGDRSRHLAMRSLEDTRYRSVPPWLQTDGEAISCAVLRDPVREEIGHTINERVVVEFYSR
ncbi:MAG: 30S ribosomal protein S4 [Puniceicoccales bacterium]|jgi:small subunit ribosomal protein S4|nr:30S ribosomal protein S4 [Puniceicoccales bacterium]